jgi:hypothetical protein
MIPFSGTRSVSASSYSPVFLVMIIGQPQFLMQKKIPNEVTAGFALTQPLTQNEDQKLFLREIAAWS